MTCETCEDIGTICSECITDGLRAVFKMPTPDCTEGKE